MTLNILFFTVTIKRRNKSAEAAMREQLVSEMYEKTKERAYTVHRLY
ncbi:YrzI family small protein [Bacillus dakarensis]|nr:YrzI family small protein [Bacillus dakarensis]